MTFRDTLLLLSLSAVVAGASAATAMEARIYKAPMPHLAAGAGKTQKMHYARLENRRSATAIKAALKLLQTQVKTCTTVNSKAGKPVNPPTEYPALVHNYTNDTYWAPNRAVQYRRWYIASVNMADCSLAESETLTATLQSSKGTCVINLISRTAKGACTGNHADAKVAPVATAPAAGSALAEMAANPGMATAAAQLAKLTAAVGPGGPTGAKQQVAGLTCDEWKLSDKLGTACFARGGSFPVVSALGAAVGMGIVLASETGDKWLSEQATQAGFDADIGDAVFAPHLGGGFRIQAGRP